VTVVLYHKLKAIVASKNNRESIVILLFLDSPCPSPSFWVILALNALAINGDLKHLIVEFFSHVAYPYVTCFRQLWISVSRVDSVDMALLLRQLLDLWSRLYKKNKSKNNMLDLPTGRFPTVSLALGCDAHNAIPVNGVSRHC